VLWRVTPTLDDFDPLTLPPGSPVILAGLANLGHSSTSYLRISLGEWGTNFWPFDEKI
jgi:hypothetical protein